MVGFLLMPQSVEWGGSICPPRKLLNLTFFCPSQSILTLDSFTIEFVFFLSPWQRGSPALTVLLHRAHPFRTPFRDLLQPRSLPANPAALSVHPRVHLSPSRAAGLASNGLGTAVISSSAPEGWDYVSERPVVDFWTLGRMSRAAGLFLKAAASSGGAARKGLLPRGEAR